MITCKCNGIEVVWRKCISMVIVWRKCYFLDEIVLWYDNMDVADLCLFLCNQFEEFHVGNLKACMKGIWKVACKEMEKWHVFSYYVTSGISAMFWLSLIHL